VHEFRVYCKSPDEPRSSSRSGGVAWPLKLVASKEADPVMGEPTDRHEGEPSGLKGRSGSTGRAVKTSRKLHSGIKGSYMNICSWLRTRLNRFLYPRTASDLRDQKFSEVQFEVIQERTKAVARVVASAQKLAETTQMTHQELASVGNRLRQAAIND